MTPTRPAISVVHFVPKGFPRLGGSEIQAGRLASALGAHGIDSRILAPRVGTQPSRETIDGLSVQRFGSARPLAARSHAVGYWLPFLAAFARAAARADGVHFHGLNASAVAGARIARRMGRWVVAKAATAGSEGDLARLAAARGPGALARLARDVDRFIAVSGQIAEEMSRFGLPAARIVRIPNGVDTERFRPATPPEREAIRCALGLGAGPLVVAAGRLVARKRLEAVLRAFAAAAPPDAALAILGDGPERERLAREAAALGIAPRVRWEGNRPDPERHFRAADLFVHAASEEGLPNALLEAMACGLPVVAPRIGGVVDVVRDGRDGVLYDAAGADAGRALAALFAMEAAPRAALGASARERVAGGWSLAAVARRMADLYRQLHAHG